MSWIRIKISKIYEGCFMIQLFNRETDDQLAVVHHVSNYQSSARIGRRMVRAIELGGKRQFQP